MKLFVAHNNSPFLTGIDTTDWSALSGVPSTPSTGKCVIALPSKNALAVGSISTIPRFNVWSLDDYSLIQSHNLPNSAQHLAAPPDESYVVVANTGSPQIVIVDTTTWDLESPASLISGTAQRVAVHPNGRLIAVGHSSGSLLTVIDKPSWSVVFTATTLPVTANGVAFSPDGSLLAVIMGTSTNSIVIFNTTTWAIETVLSTGNTGQTVAFSPNGQYLVAGRSFNPGYQVFRTSDWGEESVTNIPSTGNDIVFDPTGNYMAVAHNNSPFYSVRNVGTWSNAVNVTFPATIPSTGNGICWVPDNAGYMAQTQPLLEFSADGAEDPTASYGGLEVITPVPVFDLEGYLTTLNEGAMASQLPMFEEVMAGWSEFWGAMDVKVPVVHAGLTGFTGMEITQQGTLVGALEAIQRSFNMPSASMGMAATLDIDHLLQFISVLGASAKYDTQLVGQNTFRQISTLLSTSSISHVLSLIELMELGTVKSIEHVRALQFLSSMVAESEVEDSMVWAANLAAAFTLQSLVRSGYVVDYSSEAALASTYATHFNAIRDFQEHLLFDTSTDFKRGTQALFISAIDLDPSATTQASLNVEFRSLMGSYAMFRVGEDLYEAWVMGAGAFSQYDNYPFTRIAEFKGRYYGVADDGIYELRGDDDDGEAIQAAFKTGLMDLGARQIKDAKAFYLGYTSNGQIVLKVITTSGGKKREDWYQLKQAAADDMRTGRATIQRGLRSTYWQFEICNADGADFEIDDATLVYQMLSRRIRK